MENKDGQAAESSVAATPADPSMAKRKRQYRLGMGILIGRFFILILNLAVFILGVFGIRTSLVYQTYLSSRTMCRPPLIPYPAGHSWKSQYEWFVVLTFFALLHGLSTFVVFVHFLTQKRYTCCFKVFDIFNLVLVSILMAAAGGLLISGTIAVTNSDRKSVFFYHCVLESSKTSPYTNVNISSSNWKEINLQVTKNFTAEINLVLLMSTACLALLEVLLILTIVILLLVSYRPVVTHKAVYPENHPILYIERSQRSLTSKTRAEQ